MLKIETRLDPVEMDGERLEGLPDSRNQVIVSAHSFNDRVVIYCRGLQFTVIAKELEIAIQNAVNHA